MAAYDPIPESSTAVDELIVRALQGVASEAEERLLDAWRNASHDNERYFRETERVWASGAGLRSGGAPRRTPTVHELTWPAQAGVRPSSSPPSAGRPGWRRRAALAAVVVLVLFGVSHVVVRKSFPPTRHADTEFAAAAETRTVTLSDGTIVLLTPGSRLRVADGAVSDVWLDGRAYFSVPPRAPGQHFRVRTHAGDAVVVGTRFDLDTRNDEMHLLVVEGEVELATRGHTLAVTANQIARLGSTGKMVSERVDTSYVQRELRWMRDFLVFTETPLDQVARELTRYYGVPVELLDLSLAEQTVHAWFANEELDDVMPVICRAVEAHCEVSADRVTLTSEGGQP